MPELTSHVPDVRLISSTPVAITPETSGAFVEGVWTGNVTVLDHGDDVYLRADDGHGHLAESDLFDVGLNVPHPDLQVTDSQGNSTDHAITFGALPPADEPAAFTVTVANTGTAALNVAEATLSDTTNFSVAWDGDGLQPSTIAAGAARVATITFHPTAADTYEAQWTLDSDDPGSPSLVVTLTGTAAGPDLVGTFGAVRLSEICVPGDRGRVPVIINNAGNESAVGRVEIQVYASTDAALDPGTDHLLATLANRPIRLAPGRSKTYTATLTVPRDLPADAYYLLAHVDAAEEIPESNEANNVVSRDQDGLVQREVAWRFGEVGSRRNVRLTVEDSQNVPVTFALRGPGSGEVQGGPDFAAVVLDNTDHRSSVTISVRGRGAGTSVGDVEVHGSLRSVRARTTDLRGHITIEGALQRLQLDDVLGGQPHTLDIGTLDGPQTGVALSFDEVADLSVQSAIPIKSLTADSWIDEDGADDTIAGPSIDRVSIKAGSLAAAVASEGAVNRVTVRGGSLTGGVTGATIGAVSVRDGDLSGAVVVTNPEGLEGAVLGSVSVVGGDLLGPITVSNNGSAGSIAARFRNGGGAIGPGAITIEGSAKSITATGDRAQGGGLLRAAIHVGSAGRIRARYGSISGAITAARIGRLAATFGDLEQDVTISNAVEHADRGLALRSLSILGGDLRGALRVQNAGSVGTVSVLAHRGDGRGYVQGTTEVDGDLRSLRAQHVAANVTVEGRAPSVRIYDDDIVSTSGAPVATITVGGRATVRGQNGVIRIGNDGGVVHVE